MARQENSFNPINYTFKWMTVVGNPYGWYEFDSAEAHRQAKADRDASARALRTNGFTNVKKHSLKNNLMKRGGIGSGHPEIEELVTVYNVSWEEE